jgi:FixJ family two-component response regulator
VTAFLVYLIDDDARVLSALSRLLASEGYTVRAFPDAEAFLRCPDIEVPGCAVVDLHLPGQDGFAVQEALSARAAERPVIFLTGKGDIPDSVRAMKAGAVDFLVKPVDADTLLAAIRQAEVREASLRQRRAERRDFDARIARLTPREKQVLDQVVAGRLNKQIAGDLGTVEKTVKVHRARMMAKMGVRSVAELSQLVQRVGH